MMCLLTEVNKTGEEKSAPVYLSKLISAELKNSTLLINGVVKIPVENLMEIKYKVEK